jgi:hypothetical protein
MAEVVVLWLFLLAFGTLLIWGWRGFDELGQLIWLGYLVVSLGGAARIALNVRLRDMWSAGDAA